MSFLVGVVALVMVALAMLNVSGDFQISAEQSDYADSESVAVESTSVVTEECSYGSGEVKQRRLQAEFELHRHFLHRLSKAQPPKQTNARRASTNTLKSRRESRRLYWRAKSIKKSNRARSLRHWHGFCVLSLMLYCMGVTAVETTRLEFGVTNSVDSKIDSSTATESERWNLNQVEWDRYQTLLKGVRGHLERLRPSLQLKCWEFMLETMPNASSTRACGLKS